MPSYSFKKRFVPFVKDFTKRQTIRGIRKHPAKVGSIVSHFTGSRFKPVRIIDQQICVGAHTIFILENEDVYVYRDEVLDEASAKILLENPKKHTVKKLHNTDKYLLAWDDGFRPEGFTNILDVQEKGSLSACWFIMFSWWKQTHQLPFAGHIIQW